MRSDEQVKVLEREVDKLREQVVKDNLELRVLQERSKDRKLTDTQRTGLITALRNGERGEIEVTYASGNSEAERFAIHLAKTLAIGGWAITDNSINPAMILGSTPVGVGIVVRDPQMPSVQSLLSAFKQIDLEIQLKINPSLDRAIKLHVGTKL